MKVGPAMLKLAQHILQNKATDFDPSQFVDHYEEAVVAMLKKKQAGLPVSRERGAPRPQNVANLMDALRRSIAEEKASSTPPKKGRKRIEGQGEMLLPISGNAKKWPRQRHRNGRAPDRKMSVDHMRPLPDRCSKIQTPAGNSQNQTCVGGVAWRAMIENIRTHPYSRAVCLEAARLFEHRAATTGRSSGLGRSGCCEFGPGVSNQG